MRGKLYPFLILKIENHRALLLFSSDSPPTTSPSNNLISIQLDSITLNKIIADSEALGKVEKKINFRDVNGFQKLVRGESSKFSFIEDGGRSVCDVSCNVNCKQPPTSTVATPRPFIAKKDSATGPPYLPPVVEKKDEAIATRRTTTLFTTQPARERIVSTTKQSTTRASTTTPQSTKASTTTPRPTKASTTTLRPTKSVTRPRTSTPGPAYLPVSKISTVRRSAVTERSYPPATWPSTTRTYTQTFPTWSAPIRRSTAVTKVVTTTAKYLYKEPSNSLIYAGEAE